MNGGIYQIKNIFSDKRYIGSSANIAKRFREHKHALKHNKHFNKYLQRAWNKYGENSFKFKPLLFCAPKDLLFYEQQIIDFYGDVSACGYNLRLMAFSNLGTKWSEQSKKELSKARKGLPSNNRGKSLSRKIKTQISAKLTGRKLSAEHITKISEANKGKIISDNQKKKISIALKGKKKKYPAWNKGMKTGPRQEDVKQRISKTLTGRPKPWLKGKPAWNKGKTTGPLPKETKRKMSISAKNRVNASSNNAIQNFKKMIMQEILASPHKNTLERVAL